LAYIKMS